MTGSIGTPAEHTPLAHDALLFDDDREFVDLAVDHLRDGAAAGEHVVVACPEPRLGLLLSAVDGAFDVTVPDGDDSYGNPVATAQGYVDLTRQAVAGGATGLRIVGELPAASLQSPRMWPQWSRYEAVVNHALAELPFHALCAYDVRTTPPSVLDAVRITHRRMSEHSAMTANGGYTEPVECLRRWADRTVLPVESSTPTVEVHDIATPQAARAARTRLSDLLAHLDTALVPHAAHLPPADPTLVEAEDYLLAVDEVLANALTHGGGPATLRAWVVHDQVVATVTDPGHGFDDPFAGYVLGTPTSDPEEPGRQLGLWIARQMCEELSYRHDERGFTVRLRADLDVRAP